MSGVKIFDSGLDLDMIKILCTGDQVRLGRGLLSGQHFIYAPTSLSVHCTLRLLFLYGLGIVRRDYRTY